VQKLPSVQLLPFAFVGFEHAPLTGSQVPARWHWSEAAQTTGFFPLQAPATQVSVCVHRLPSLHDAPSALAGLEHSPVAALQMPASWHWSAAAHVTGLAPVHTPPWQVSDWVHLLPSSHEAPSALEGAEQVPVAESHVPASWH
jgi:hypothetical protein